MLQEDGDSDAVGGAAAATGPAVAGRPAGVRPPAWRGGASIFSEEGVGIDRLDA
jgi:hypothetical protein